MPRHQGDPDTRRTSNFLTLNNVGIGCGFNKAFGDVFRILDGHVRQDYREFIAAQAPEYVVRPQAGAEPVPECFQQRVANLVTEAIVDALEAVQVQVEHGARGTAAHAGLALFFETAAIQHTSQWIGCRNRQPSQKAPPIETLSATSLGECNHHKSFPDNNLQEAPSHTVPRPTERDRKHQAPPLFNSHRALTSKSVVCDATERIQS